MLFSAVVLLAGGVTAVRGQFADGFDPNANGSVYVTVVQPDGKILIGGNFTTLSPNGGAAVSRNYIARLNPDGTLDTAFNPNGSGGFLYFGVFAIALQADGKILVGGDFTGMGGQTRNHIARLDPTTGLADSWNPNAPDTNDFVYSIAVQADGRILVGGNFSGANSTVGGQPRNFIARLDPVTGLADSWNPSASLTVYSVAVQADGKILVGGTFTGIGGQTRNQIARLDATTGLADSFNPNANDYVQSTAVQADGKILAGGQFTSIGGQPHNHIARLDATTGLADSFDPNANGSVYPIAVQADGKILAGGQFTSIGGQTRNYIARLDPTTGSADSFDPNANGQVRSVAVQADGKILVGGQFTTLAPNGGGAVTRNGIARLGPGSPPAITSADNTAFSVGSNGSFTVTATGIPTPTLSESGALPSGVTFTPATGVLGGTPAAGTAGTYPITFTASNGVGSPGMQSFTLTVIQPQQAPAITSADNTAFSVGSNGSFTVTATGFPTPTLSESGALPSGVTFTPATGVLGGTPAAGTAGTYPITFTASNGVGGAAMQSFTLTVIQPPQAPAITSANNTVFAVGSNGSFAVTATGFPTPTLSESGALPSGVTFVPATGVLGGTPAAGTAGTYPITFTASNGVGSPAMQNFTLTVNRAPFPSALDGFDPNADGPVWVAVVQPDGKILIGGEFTTLSPNGGVAVTRNHIARLNVDGTLDPAFDPNANGIVRSIALQTDGKIMVGGDFFGANSIGGATRNYIARLDATTGAADSLDPSANNTVYAIAVQTDGKILAGGVFTNIGGATRNRMARLDAITGLADSFDPGANNDVHSIVVQADGKILAGGAFTNIGGATRNRMARLDATTGLADSFDPSANNDVHSIALQADGKILAGGVFTNIGGQPRNYIARLDPATGLADSFNPNANAQVYAIAVQADGRILVGGSFNGANSIGGATRNHIARLDATTGLADSFDPNADDIVYVIALQADAKILAGGAFTTLAPNGGPTVTRNRIARLETDGRLDQTLDLGIAGSQVNTMAVQPDGKVIIAGIFSSVLGVARNNIARLNSDGTLDMAFDPGVNASVYSIALQTDGKILVGGVFTNVGGQSRSGIARLDAVTGAADSWDPNAGGNSNEVDAMAVQPDGKILVGGNFSVIGGATRRFIARLDATTGLADSWDPNSISQVYTIALQPDGKIVVGGGFFGNIGGQFRDKIARLDPVSGAADSFSPITDATVVYTIVVQADGKILVGGRFGNMGGQARNSAARLDGVTGLADSFDPNTNVNQLGGVYTMAVQADGKVLMGGSFSMVSGQLRTAIARLDPTTGVPDSFFDADATNGAAVFSAAVQADGKTLVAGNFASIGGQNRNSFARLTNDTAALQNVIVTPGIVTWTRGGASPLLARVTFEYSTDSVNYTLLGNATASGSDWTLTSLSLPTSQNFCIRARGYYRSSFLSAAGSIQESVRNAFIAGTSPTQVVSRKLHNGTPRDINLPLIGNSGIECRSGGATNDYQVVFTFANSVTFSAAAVTAGAGSVSGSSGSGTTIVTVNLTGITNAQRITITLSNVSDGTNSNDFVVPIGILVGDTNGDGFVNAGDALQTRNRSGQAADTTNFRSDVNADGFVNSGDTTAVRSRSGTSLP